MKQGQYATKKPHPKPHCLSQNIPPSPPPLNNPPHLLSSSFLSSLTLSLPAIHSTSLIPRFLPNSPPPSFPPRPLQPCPRSLPLSPNAPIPLSFSTLLPQPHRNPSFSIIPLFHIPLILSPTPSYPQSPSTTTPTPTSKTTWAHSLLTPLLTAAGVCTTTVAAVFAGGRQLVRSHPSCILTAGGRVEMDLPPECHCHVSIVINLDHLTHFTTCLQQGVQG